MQDVEFRLTVRRDSAIRSQLRAFEKEVLESQKRLEAARQQMMRNSNAILLRQTRLFYREEDRVRQQVTQRERQWLQTREREYRQFTKRANSLRPQLAGAAGPQSAGGGIGAGLLGGALAGGSARLSGMVGGLFAGAAVIGLGRSSLSYFSELEALQFRLEALTGSAAKAKDVMEDLRNIELMSGIDRSALAQSVQTMNGFGISIDMAKEKMQEFAAIAGGDTQRLQRLALAFAQIGGNGRLMGEELNQMIDAGFNPLIAISSRTGKSIVELREEMRKGQVSFAQVAQAITDVTSAGGKYGNMMAAMQQSTQVKLGKMRAEWNKFKEELGKDIAGIVTSEPVSGTLTTGSGLLADAAKGLNAAFNQDLNLMVEQQQGRFRKGLIPFWSGLSTSDVTREASLDAQLAEQQKRTAEFSDARKKTEDGIGDAVDEQLRQLVKQLPIAKQLADVRVESAKEELELRKDIRKEAQAAFDDAKKEMQSARERFGGMTKDEQRATVQAVLKARRGVGTLNLDEIGLLQGLGTAESNRLASQALLMRSRGGFGSSNAELANNLSAQENLRRRRAEITRNARGAFDAAGQPTGGRTFSASARSELSDIENRLRSLVGQELAIRQAGPTRAAIRESIFDSNRRQIDQARGRLATVTADVKQKIELVTNFEFTARQVAEQVMQLVQHDLSKYGKEVQEGYARLAKEIEKNRQLALARAQGRGQF